MNMNSMVSRTIQNAAHQVNEFVYGGFLCFSAPQVTNAATKSLRPFTGCSLHWARKPLRHLLCIWMSSAPSSYSPEKQRGDKTEESSHEDPELQTCGNSQLRRTALGGWRMYRMLQEGKSLLLNWWLAGWGAVYCFLLLLSASFVNLSSLNLLPKHQKMVAGSTEQEFLKCNRSSQTKNETSLHGTQSSFSSTGPQLDPYLEPYRLVEEEFSSAIFSGVDALSPIFKCETTRSAEQKDAV